MCSIVGILANLSEISRHSRSYGDTQHWVAIVIGILLVALLWVTITLINKWGKVKRVKTVTPQKSLLTELAEYHHLTTAESQLLSRLASKNFVQPPEVLLIDPALWAPCLEACPGERPQLVELMAKLFGADRCEQWLAETPPAETISVVQR